MKNYHAKNERIKREYFRFQINAGGKAEATLNGIRKALDRLRPLIAAAQGELAPEEVPGRLLHQASGGVAPVETPPAPVESEQPPGAAG